MLVAYTVFRELSAKLAHIVSNSVGSAAKIAGKTLQSILGKL